MKAILAQKIRTMASWHWLLLFGSILAAWVMLLLMAVLRICTQPERPTVKVFGVTSLR